MAKRVRLWASSWIAGGDVEETLLGGRVVAGEVRPGWLVQAGQARSCGVAGDRAAFGIGQVVAEPGMALRERLRMRVHTAAMPASESIFLSRLWRT